MAQFKDLTGRRFGRWTVLYRTTDHIEPNGYKRVVYRCRCDCGKEVDVISGSLSKGQSRSCGCLQREYAKSGKGNRTHGMTGTRIYRAWKNMHTRCYNPKNKKYSRYGGRGIQICEEWNGEKGFENFKKWAYSNGYAENLTIDRIDNDGNYSPSNCRWIKQKAQASNKSTNRFIECDGNTKTVAEWGRTIGISPTHLYWRTNDQIQSIIHQYLETRA